MMHDNVKCTPAHDRKHTHTHTLPLVYSYHQGIECGLEHIVNIVCSNMEVGGVMYVYSVSVCKCEGVYLCEVNNVGDGVTDVQRVYTVQWSLHYLTPG